ncbi:MAG: ParB/RepB/Spo0J family partition protein [Planctomycetota bacterium]|nr:ParB/RepB/Spo0J family partition protein [Planctomycetota bacterium]
MRQTTRPVAIEKIHVDDASHPRAKVNEETVAEYAEAMRGKAKFPAIVVFAAAGKSGYFLGDGRHRLEAAKQTGKKVIDAEIRPGGQREAILYAVGANNEHGLRRSNADKRKAVELLLADPEWREWSVNELAQRCHVSWDLVEAVRKAHLPEAEDSGSRLVERGRTVYTQKTGRIGKKRDSETMEEPPTPVRMVLQMLNITKHVKASLGADQKAELTKPLEEIADRLRRLVGRATGGIYLTEGLREPLNVYQYSRGEGITATPEFEKKGLCRYALNVGLICGHQCTYCSTHSLLYKMVEPFKTIGQTCHARGFAVVDPDTPARIAKDIPALTDKDIVQMCTLDDAWSPEARKYNLGRKCLEVLLERTPAQVRVLTKNAEVAADFDLMKKYPGRVIVGLSTGIPPSRQDAADAMEPNASPVQDRLKALRTAHRMGLRTFGMLCPCPPGIADSEAALGELFDAVVACGVEDIWLEPINARGKGPGDSADALHTAGLSIEADAVRAIAKKAAWPTYATDLIKAAIAVATSRKVLKKLHVLLYPTKYMTPQQRAELKSFGSPIIWLEKEVPEKPKEKVAAEPKRKRRGRAQLAGAAGEKASAKTRHKRSRPRPGRRVLS